MQEVGAAAVGLRRLSLEPRRKPRTLSIDLQGFQRRRKPTKRRHDGRSVTVGPFQLEHVIEYHHGRSRI